MSASDLGKAAIEEALNRAGGAAEDVSEGIMGQILTAGTGQNPARQASIAAGIPVEAPAYGVNQLCGSGLKAVAMGLQAITVGDSGIVVAGGQESMSQSPHCIHMRDGKKLGNAEMVDTMIKDGLWDAFNGYHMGNTAENVAEQWQITCEEQDSFAVWSQHKAEADQKAGRFKDEIVPVTYAARKGDVTVSEDEHPTHGTTAEGLGKLRPAFDRGGTVTAGNASGINDGAAALVLMTGEEASQAALEKAGWTVDDLDLIEANEAFAAQSLAVGRELGWDADKLNVNGGAIAIGHPIGASGARGLVTLLYEMRKRDAKKGLATLCIGGGRGSAMCVERD